MASGLARTDRDHAPDLYTARLMAHELVDASYAYLGFIGDLVEQVGRDEHGLYAEPGFDRFVRGMCADVGYQPADLGDGAMELARGLFVELTDAQRDFCRSFDAVSTELGDREYEEVPSVGGLFGSCYAVAAEKFAQHLAGVTYDGIQRFTSPDDWDDCLDGSQQGFTTSNFYQTCLLVVDSLPDDGVDHPENVHELIRQEFLFAFQDRCSVNSVELVESTSGVTLFDAALYFDGDTEAARELVKSWHSRKIITAPALGRSARDARARVYGLLEILSDLSKLFEMDASEKSRFTAHLTDRLQPVRAK